MTDVKPFAFVLMPFDKSFNDIYKFGIKQTASDLGIVAERVDEQHFSETILERIYRQIDNSDFVIAEMSGQNPNVFYEVGFAHAKSKPCILITQSAKDIPFDLKHHSHVVYDGSVEDLVSKLKPKLEWMQTEIQNLKLKTISLFIKSGAGFLDKESSYFHTGSFTLTIDFRNLSQKRSPEIEAIYVTTSPNWTLTVDDKECPSNLADGDRKLKRHLIKPPLQRLAPSAFSQVKVEFVKTLWSKSSGEEDSKDEYQVRGHLTFEIVTSEGSFFEEKALDVTFNEIPF